MSSTQPLVDTRADAELISAVRGGDLNAYGELFARHADAARRLARQLVSSADADDLVSESFAKVLTVLQRGGGPDIAFRAYLLTAVRRLHVDRIRATSRVQTTDDLEPFDPGTPFEDTAVAGFENEAAAKAFASLPERWQLVLWHLEVEGQKPGDIAPMLGMSANSVSALAYRAREGLRQAFLNQHAQDLDNDTCEWTHQHLGAYIRNGISRRDAAKVEEHLDECRKCMAIYLELSEVNSNLAGILGPLLLGAAATGYLATAGGLAAKGGLLLLVGRAKEAVVGNLATAAVAGVAATAVIAGTAVAVLTHQNDQDLSTADNQIGAVSPGNAGQGGDPGTNNGDRGGDQGKGGPTVTPSESTNPSDPVTSPTDPSSTPTDPSSTPTDPTDPTSSPSDPTSAPTDPTSTPTDPTSTPTDPTSSPSDPTSTPTDPTSTPTDPTSSPSDPSSTPTDPTSSPSDPTSTPTDPTSSPSDPTSTPTDPTSSPSDPTSTPTDPTSSPSDPTSTPTDPTSSPSDPTSTPTDPTSTPAVFTDVSVSAAAKRTTLVSWDVVGTVSGLNPGNGVTVTVTVSNNLSFSRDLGSRCTYVNSRTARCHLSTPDSAGDETLGFTVPATIGDAWMQFSIVPDTGTPNSSTDNDVARIDLDGVLGKSAVPGGDLSARP
ncbi:MAG: sigma-70 family RNA polymerase sigma factor [Nocardioides sp.]|uniref:sigma-70 family RNA polymerase sigma factor n=1 Tax=Nocardioides sp. TaxID=35761 RepID=UPI0039E703A3